MTTDKKAKEDNLVRAFTWCLVLSLVIIFSIYPIASKDLVSWAGPVLLALGLAPLAVLKIHGKQLATVGADIAFGAFDTGFMTVTSLAGASFAGVLGAVVGAGAGDAITDAWGGLIEGKVATWLRKRGIEEARKPFPTSMGKMSGCLFGAGVTITIAGLLGIL